AKTKSTLRRQNHPRHPLQGWLRGSIDQVEVSDCHLPGLKHCKDRNYLKHSRENQAAVLISFFNCMFRRIEFSVQCAAFSLSSVALRNPSFCLRCAWYVSIVFTLRCNSVASLEAPKPRPINEKTCSSRSLSGFTSDRAGSIWLVARLSKRRRMTLGLAYRLTSEILLSAFTTSEESSSSARYACAPARKARWIDNGSSRAESTRRRAVMFT